MQEVNKVTKKTMGQGNEVMYCATAILVNVHVAAGMTVACSTKIVTSYRTAQTRE